MTDTGDQQDDVIVMKDTGDKYDDMILMTDTGDKHDDVILMTDTGDKYDDVILMTDTGNKYDVILMTDTQDQCNDVTLMKDTGHRFDVILMTGTEKQVHWCDTDDETGDQCDDVMLMTGTGEKELKNNEGQRRKNWYKIMQPLQIYAKTPKLIPGNPYMTIKHLWSFFQQNCYDWANQLEENGEQSGDPVRQQLTKTEGKSKWRKRQRWVTLGVAIATPRGKSKRRKPVTQNVEAQQSEWRHAACDPQDVNKLPSLSDSCSHWPPGSRGRHFLPPHGTGLALWRAVHVAWVQAHHALQWPWQGHISDGHAQE